MTELKRDYSETLFLPQTEFPMRAGLPEREPVLLDRWKKEDLYGKLRQAAKGRRKFILHDGPPYANGNIHIGTALNKILKDVVTRSQQMLGFDSNYVPGWDCHGLPIEWKIEEEYRAKGKNKDAIPINEFRKECRAFAQHWIGVQMAEFKRLGVEGDWENYYSTMRFPAEAQIAREIMKFAKNGTLYRGSKPVMWSVVEKTALAEAEVEYEDYQSDTVWVKFPVSNLGVMLLEDTVPGPYPTEPNNDALKAASVLIWTTTPWTLPGNRAISYSSKIAYGLYEVTEAATDNWAKTGDKFVLADNLAESVFKQARVTKYKRIVSIPASVLDAMTCAHPLRGKGYDFLVPLFDGDHVTDDTGTGFVHTAPGHGREDFDIWMDNKSLLDAAGINTTIPYTVDENGAFTEAAPSFTGRRVLDDKGEKGDANDAVIKALVEAGMLIARGRLKHQYPHSWRSKKPVIYRNTPQWFIAMDEPITTGHIRWSPDSGVASYDTLRNRALKSIQDTQWIPPAGENRITGMIESRPDWVISRQRAWGVPITVFVKEKADGSVAILDDAAVDKRIGDAFEQEGADAWYADGAAARFLGSRASEGWKKVDDILDVWFDSGSTHAFVLEDPKNFPQLAGIQRKPKGDDLVMYLEGSDQHRGWFQSSLLESCGTRGHAPFDMVLTHGFVLDEHGRKMSKSLGNTVAPQDVIKNSGADILRMWACASDYADDLRIGPEILKTNVETYRKLRNTIRWMLGSLAHFHEDDRVAVKDMPELERLMLHRLAELDGTIRQAYEQFDYKRIFAQLSAFMTGDLSAFYFDIRKDTLYCDPISSKNRKAALTVVDHLFRGTVKWLAPMLCFTAEEAWLSRYGDGAPSVHLQVFPKAPAEWRDDALAEKWRKIRLVRRVVTSALEIQRAAKNIGSSLEASPIVYLAREFTGLLSNDDWAEVCITSGFEKRENEATSLGQDVPYSEKTWEKDAEGLFADHTITDRVAVVFRRAHGKKCARSWKITESVGEDPAYPDVTPRDAKALREWDSLRKAAE